MRDTQKKRLYAWEEQWATWNESHVSLAECKKFIRMACRAYKVTPPPIALHRHTGHSYYDPSSHRLSLRKDQMNVPIALHEAAHAVVWAHYGLTIEDHGPEFLGVYVHLLVASNCAPRVAIEASLKHAGLVWNPNMQPENMIDGKLPAVKKKKARTKAG